MLKGFNILGLILALPFLIAAGMSTDATGKIVHWSHEFFVLTNMAVGPLALVGLLSKRFKYLGLAGLVLAFTGWYVVMMFCGPESIACKE